MKKLFLAGHRGLHCRLRVLRRRDHHRAALGVRGKEANQRNFTEAVARTMIWEIVARGGIFALTFLLPPRPRCKQELECIAAEAGIPI